MDQEGRKADANRGQAHEAGGSCSLKANASLRELVEFLARNLVTHPESVEVHETVAENATTIELRVHKEDLGRVIGKQGRTAKSLRTIINAAASRTNLKAALEIIEE